MKETHILVVDDDTSMRMALCETLESCGYLVEAAANGSEALDKFRAGAFEAVITDMRMPGMSGMDVLKSIKKISPESPVILITAYGTVNTAVEAMKEGASDFIMKPFSLEDIEFVVKNVLATQARRTKGEDGRNEKSRPPTGRSSHRTVECWVSLNSSKRWLRANPAS